MSNIITSSTRLPQLPNTMTLSVTDSGELSEAEWLALFQAKAKNDYSFYCEYVHRGAWLPARHLNIVCQKIEAVEQGKIKRLMIFMPPRHSKSMTVTETFPSYFIGRNPERRVIEVSYGDTLAQRFGRFNRQKIAEYGEGIFGIRLDRSKSSATDWDIEGHRGGMISVGIGGGITGQGADLAIIDDPVKNREEANSPTYRQKVWDEWENSILTRLHPGAAVIIILTRWHPDDLAGRLLMQEPEKWDVVSLPAIAEIDDLLGRKPGDALWPERGYDTEWAADQESAVGPYTWAALYQQRPTPLEGGMFKAEWLRWYTRDQVHFDEQKRLWTFAGEPMRLWQGVDPAISEKEAVADDFACVTVGVTPTNKVVILEPWAGHLDFIEQIRLLITKYQEWLPDRVGIETNAFQRALRQQITRDAMIPVRSLEHKIDKYTRIENMVPYWANGQVYFRMSLPDEPGFMDQTRLPGIRIHEKFRKIYEQAVTYGPKAAHDDLLDALYNCFEMAHVPANRNEFYTGFYESEYGKRELSAVR